MDGKSFMILGGCGFVGRNVVHHLVQKYPDSKIRVVDKLIPPMAYLNKQHESSFNNPRVEFINCNLISKDSREKAFQSESVSFDYVINCAGETKHGLSDAIYHEGIVDLSVSCARLSAKYNVKRYLEISSGSVYEKKDRSIQPRTTIAKYKLMVEEELKKISGLNYTILRPPLVYGLGDTKNLAPRTVVAAIYRYIEETMRLLGGKDLKVYTVHVDDLCQAIDYVLARDDTLSETYNVVDDGCTTQGIIGDLLKEMFDVSVEYLNDFSATMCYVKINTNSAIKDINEKHMKPWSEICAINNIQSTPLSPYLYRDDLCIDDICLNADKLKSVGFKFTHPIITKELLEEVVNDFKSMGLFPLIYTIK